MIDFMTLILLYAPVAFEEFRGATITSMELDKQLYHHAISRLVEN